MFRFEREKILLLVLTCGMTLNALARKAHVGHRTLCRAINGLPVTSSVVDKICVALAVNPLDYLMTPAQAKEAK